MAAMIPTLSFCCHIWRRYDSLFMQTPCRVGTTHMSPKGPLLAEHKFRTGEKVVDGHDVGDALTAEKPAHPLLCGQFSCPFIRAGAVNRGKAAIARW